MLENDSEGNSLPDNSTPEEENTRFKMSDLKILPMSFWL